MSYGRNLGAKSSSGEILLFIDSDNVVEVNTIKECVNAIKGYDIALPKIYALHSKVGYYGVKINYLTSQTRVMINSFKIPSCNSFFIKKDSFKKVMAFFTARNRIIFHYKYSGKKRISAIFINIFMGQFIERPF